MALQSNTVNVSGAPHGIPPTCFSALHFMFVNAATKTAFGLTANLAIAKNWSKTTDVTSSNIGPKSR